MAVPPARSSDSLREIRDDAVHTKRSDPRDIPRLVDRIDKDAQPIALQHADEFAAHAVEPQPDVGDLGVSRKRRRAHRYAIQQGHGVSPGGEAFDRQQLGMEKRGIDDGLNKRPSGHARPTRSAIPGDLMSSMSPTRLLMQASASSSVGMGWPSAVRTLRISSTVSS